MFLAAQGLHADLGSLPAVHTAASGSDCQWLAVLELCSTMCACPYL